MWGLNVAKEPVLPEEEWLRAMRIRLGCSQLSGEIMCASCGRHVLDTTAYHARCCCAKGESTRGHNRVRNTMHAGFVASDPGAAIEVLGLMPSQPELRPADVLTTAAKPNVTSAVDVGIRAPHAAGAGDDCAESYRREKMETYRAYIPELTAQGIEYVPATFSAYGRRHPCVTAMLTQASREAARRKGLRSHEAIVRRWCRSLACEVWRRASRMVRACLPREPSQTELILDGERDEGLEPDEEPEVEERQEMWF